MMFGYLVLAGTMIVCSNTAPQPQGKGRYGTKGGYFFEGKLDGVQGALHDIETAGKVLATLEGQLEKLNTNSGSILKAEIAIEKGIATADINNSWNGGGGDTVCNDVVPNLNPNFPCVGSNYYEQIKYLKIVTCDGMYLGSLCKEHWSDICEDGDFAPFGTIENTCRRECRICTA